MADHGGVIAYAACIGDREKYTSICLPGLLRVTTDADLIIEATHPSSIFTAYNEVLDAVRERDDLEALVLLHEDTEILSPELPRIVRERLAEPDVAILGCVGARGITGLSWWEAPERFGAVVETRGLLHFSEGMAEVDTVDGLFMALSPWAVRNLRFDEDSYTGFDAYDADICAQARALGKRVVAQELPIVHRHTRVGVLRAESGAGSFPRNDRVFREKWRDQLRDADERRAASGAGVRDDATGSDSYFEHTRPELRALVPPEARRVLDVGCGAGALGAALKGQRPDAEVVGLEAFPDAAERARTRLDDVLLIDLDGLTALPEDAGTFDAMIFGDVLEHLRDPEGVLRALLPSLRPDGVCIFSIPNVRHWTVVYPLLVKDRWEHADAGLLDRTHMHFFTLEEFIPMLAAVGLQPSGIGVNDLQPLPENLLPFAAVAQTVGGERSDAVRRLGVYQYLVTAIPGGTPSEPAVHPPAEPPAAGDDLLALVPETARRLLDIGCGAGRTGEALRERLGCEVVGVESDLGFAETARTRLDDVIVADLETLESVPGTFDALLLDGTIVRVRDPARLLRALLPALADDGVIVLAVPNVKHWSVIAPLFAEDRWTYTDDGGLLDRRNFHFMTLQETSDLLDDVGLEATHLSTRADPLPSELGVLVDIAADYGAEREETLLRLSAREYLIAARPAGES
jgi:SAM-dependent methyltransferase